MAGKGSSNTTGFFGVSRNSKSNTYRAIYKGEYLGSFDHPEKAAEAVKAAKFKDQKKETVDWFS